jgi:hypothetical protein
MVLRWPERPFLPLWISEGSQEYHVNLQKAGGERAGFGSEKSAGIKNNVEFRQKVLHAILYGSK